ncbi:MAG: Rne/Rng family ribonuclease [Thermaerobacter sp.]|nr:Rne/Rng family ribonuclease [Thermaerobacter sp.]
MRREILVNVEPLETRAAILEDGELVELLVERPIHQRAVGNIFKGRVENVLPGMEAAFVAIGLEKNAFLHVGDAGALYDEDDGIEEQQQQQRRKFVNIDDVVRSKQEIMVQVVKEAIGTKGARVTTNVSLPGRYIVLTPMNDFIGVSRRITDEKERARLKAFAESSKPEGAGVIVRTVAEGRPEAELQQDMEFLKRLWSRIQRRAQVMNAPAVLHKDIGLTFRIVRDMLTDEVEHVWIDNKEEYERVVELADTMSTDLRQRIRLWPNKSASLFDAFNLEPEIEKAIRRKVWLHCGGYLVIDQTEALTVVDVNTGKFVGNRNLAETVLRANLEAAEEIARQVRLRDLAGIIIVDFIDMDRPEDRQKVLTTLEEAVRHDRTKVHILGLTQLGLVEMTRKKVGHGLEGMLLRTCPDCEGRGRVLSEETMAQKVRRDIRALLRKEQAEAVLVEVNPAVAALLIGTGGAHLREFEKELGRSVYVRGSEELRIETMRMPAIGSREEVERQARPVQPGQEIELRIEEQHQSNPDDGIARLEGYVIDVQGAGRLVGERVKVHVTGAFRTFARARVVRQKGEVPSAT